MGNPWVYYVTTFSHEKQSKTMHSLVISGNQKKRCLKSPLLSKNVFLTCVEIPKLCQKGTELPKAIAGAGWSKHTVDRFRLMKIISIKVLCNKTEGGGKFTGLWTLVDLKQSTIVRVSSLIPVDVYHFHSETWWLRYCICQLNMQAISLMHLSIEPDNVSGQTVGSAQYTAH